MKVEEVDCIPPPEGGPNACGKWIELFRGLSPGQVVCVTPEDGQTARSAATSAGISRRRHHPEFADIIIAQRSSKIYIAREESEPCE